MNLNLKWQIKKDNYGIKYLMGIIVQKFGGTSVGSGERLCHVADIIGTTRRRKPVIAVVSAMSSTVKARGTTILLLAAGEQAVADKPFDEPLEAIEQVHLEALAEAVGKASLRNEVKGWLKDELAWLRSFLDAIRVIRELSPRSQDILMATGEKFSARLLAATLESRGVPSIFTDLTYAVPEKEKQVDPAFFRRVQKILAEICAPRKRVVPVVTGFFGMVPGGLLRAVGRGYTDFTSPRAWATSWWTRCRSGRRWTASSPPIRARSPRPGC
jgi:aspartate kinase